MGSQSSCSASRPPEQRRLALAAFVHNRSVSDHSQRTRSRGPVGLENRPNKHDHIHPIVSMPFDENPHRRAGTPRLSSSIRVRARPHPRFFEVPQTDAGRPAQHPAPTTSPAMPNQASFPTSLVIGERLSAHRRQPQLALRSHADRSAGRRPPSQRAITYAGIDLVVADQATRRDMSCTSCPNADKVLAATALSGSIGRTDFPGETRDLKPPSAPVHVAGRPSSPGHGPRRRWDGRENPTSGCDQARRVG